MTSFLCDESGATAIEYTLIISLIAAAIIISLGAMGVAVSNMFGSVQVGFDAAVSSAAGTGS